MTTNSNAWLGLFALSALAFCGFLDYTIVSTALPSIQQSLNMPLGQLQWIMNAYYLACCIGMVVMGRIGDHIGPKRWLVFMSFVFLLATIACALADKPWVLIGGRFIQGLGGAAIFPLAYTLVNHLFNNEKREKAIGINNTITGIGLVIGPTVGGLLVHYFNWRSVFWINCPLIIIALLLIIPILPRDHIEKNDEKIDFSGVLLLTCAMGGLVNAVSQLSLHAFREPIVWLSLLISIIGWPLFLYHEKRHPHPILNLHFYSRRLFQVGSLCALLGGLAVSIALFFEPLYLQHIRLQTAAVAGWWLLLIPLSTTFVGIFLAKILSYIPLVKLIFASIVIAAFCTGIQIFTSATSPIFYFALALSGIGFLWGITNNLAGLASQKAVTPAEYGAATGATFTMFNVAGSLGVAIMTWLFHFQEKRQLLSAANLSSHHVLNSIANNPALINHFLVNRQTDTHLFQILSNSYLYGFHSVILTTSILLLMGSILVWQRRK